MLYALCRFTRYVNSHNINCILRHFRKLLTWFGQSWDTAIRRLSLTIVYLCLPVLITQSCKTGGYKLLQLSMLKYIYNSAIVAVCILYYRRECCRIWCNIRWYAGKIEQMFRTKILGHLAVLRHS